MAEAEQEPAPPLDAETEQPAGPGPGIPVSTRASTQQRLRTEDVLMGNKSFTDLDVAPTVVQALAACGYDRPSPVQQAAIPLGRLGSDLLVQACARIARCLFLCSVSVSNPTSAAPCQPIRRRCCLAQLPETGSGRVRSQPSSESLWDPYPITGAIEPITRPDMLAGCPQSTAPRILPQLQQPGPFPSPNLQPSTPSGCGSATWQPATCQAAVRGRGLAVARQPVGEARLLPVPLHTIDQFNSWTGKGKPCTSSVPLYPTLLVFPSAPQCVRSAFSCCPSLHAFYGEVEIKAALCPCLQAKSGTGKTVVFATICLERVKLEINLTQVHQLGGRHV